MLIVDLIAGAVVLCFLAWGVWTGIGGTLTPAFFAAGVLAGAVLGPLPLNDGRLDDFALVVAIPVALILGGLVAAVVERKTTRLRRRFDRLDRLRTASAIGGGILALWIGTVAIWLIAATVRQVKAVHEDVEDSRIVAQLHEVVDPPGPQPSRTDVPFDSFPTATSVVPPILPVDPKLERDPQVRKADRSVVKVSVVGCRGSGIGSGWVARNGIVATNAHVVTTAELVMVQVGGKGREHRATVIWLDRRNDVALLRVPSLRGMRPPLPIVPRPKAETPGAALGFPGGEHDIRASRIGRTTATIGGKMSEIGRGFPRTLSGRLITPFRGSSGPGSSGGPIVDGRGRVITMVFGGAAGPATGVGVPTRFVISALKKAGPAVDTGSC